MKLFGNSRNSKHAGKGRASQATRSGGRGSRKAKKKRTGLKVVFVILLILFTLTAAAFAVGKLWIKPPDVINPGVSSHHEQIDLSSGKAPSLGDRTSGKYTFAIFGVDDGNGNTDTIMVGTFDTENHAIDVISIPRDTLVNVSWHTKKVNTLYANLGVEGAVDRLSTLLGYKLDFYALVDLDAFKTVVDAVGGVYYDVPIDMNYEDPAQDLYIHVKAGPQLLSGEEAMGVVRYRKGYAMADIGRIDTQQDFLLTIATQVLANKEKVDLGSLINIFVNDVKTDLSYGELLWFAQEFYKVDSENIRFETIPANYGDQLYQGGHWVSYVTIYVDEWLTIINERLNPFDMSVSLENLSILTRHPDTKQIYSTNGVYANGSNSLGNTIIGNTPSSDSTSNSDSTSDSGNTSNPGGSSNSDDVSGSGSGTIEDDDTPETAPAA